MAIFMVFIVSCEKVDENETVFQAEVVAKSTELPPWGLHRTYLPIPKICVFPATNCWDDVVIKPVYDAVKLSFIDVILNNNEEYIKKFINENLEELSTTFSEKYLANVLTDNLILSVDLTELTYFVIFTDKKSNEIVIVYPIVVLKD